MKTLLNQDLSNCQDDIHEKQAFLLYEIQTLT